MNSGASEGSTALGGDTARTLASLRRFVRPREVLEPCELCAAPLQAHPRHEHLLEREGGEVQCCCTACALLFPLDAGKRFLRIPREVWRLDGFEMSDDQWDALAIPVKMAYVLLTLTTREPRAYYPSPAGATESLLTLEGWEDLVRLNPSLTRIRPGVEALLVNRVGGGSTHYIVPIDRCYELVGIIRLNWRGLSGGQEVWQSVGDFFSRLDRYALALEACAVA